MATPFEVFCQQVGALALASKLPDIVVVVRDPNSRQVKYLATQSGMHNLRADIAAKLQLADPQSLESTTGWD
jgi:hypothetical protein